MTSATFHSALSTLYLPIWFSVRKAFHQWRRVKSATAPSPAVRDPCLFHSTETACMQDVTPVTPRATGIHCCLAAAECYDDKCISCTYLRQANSSLTWLRTVNVDIYFSSAGLRYSGSRLRFDRCHSAASAETVHHFLRDKAWQFVCSVSAT